MKILWKYIEDFDPSRDQFFDIIYSGGITSAIFSRNDYHYDREYRFIKILSLENGVRVFCDGSGVGTQVVNKAVL